MSKAFIDTNILVYAMDQSNRKKQARARALLQGAGENKMGVISTQVLQEFYVAATRKLNVEPLLAKEIIHSLMHFEIVTVDHHLIKEAIDCSILNRISFWDALVIVSAESAKCSEIWSEDLNDGQIIRGVKIVNPFR